ncbi:MAG: beta-propeller fold lactonase family protein [Chloroflexota bacterium]|nr:beta-propeller fold lactonase family protein [Chloroflexota bacterium]
MSGRRAATALAACLLLGACSSSTPSPSSGPSGAGLATSSPSTTGVASPSPTAEPTATPVPTGGVYAATVSGQIDPSLFGIPARVYVPNETSGDVSVIDPATFAVVGHFTTGAYPEHITPDWDLQRLYVSNMNGGTLTPVDPRTSQPGDSIALPIFPYAVYFMLDGEKAMVVTDYISPKLVKDNGITFYNRRTWERLAYVQVPWPGADDLDLSADGSYLMISCEYSGVVAKVDTKTMAVTGHVDVGSLPRDVRLAPDGRSFFIANEGLDGIQVVDPQAMTVTGFIPTGNGAHGIEFSRDTSQMFVANRAAGSISVIDLASLKVVATWQVGGSPDEMSLSPDGSQLWVSNRYHGSVSVIDTTSGKVIHTIPVGSRPHGLTYWPQPGRMSIGQNGNMR